MANEGMASHRSLMVLVAVLVAVEVSVMVSVVGTVEETVVVWLVVSVVEAVLVTVVVVEPVEDAVEEGELVTVSVPDKLKVLAGVVSGVVAATSDDVASDELGVLEMVELGVSEGVDSAVLEIVELNVTEAVEVAMLTKVVVAVVTAGKVVVLVGVVACVVLAVRTHAPQRSGHFSVMFNMFMKIFPQYVVVKMLQSSGSGFPLHRAVVIVLDAVVLTVELTDIDLSPEPKSSREGVSDGNAVGFKLGSKLGVSDGLNEGVSEGSNVGDSLGSFEGDPNGDLDGESDGDSDGSLVWPSAVGDPVGEGDPDGATVSHSLLITKSSTTVR